MGNPPKQLGSGITMAITTMITLTYQNGYYYDDHYGYYHDDYYANTKLVLVCGFGSMAPGPRQDRYAVDQSATNPL